MSSKLANGYTGFHSFTYDPKKFVCLGKEDDCRHVVGSHPNNYYACSSCQAETSLKSLIITLKSDDVQRYEAKLRLKSAQPIQLHKEVKKLHEKFISKGGVIKIIKVPKIIMGPSGKVVASIIYD